MCRPDHSSFRKRSTSSNLNRWPEDLQDRKGKEETKQEGQEKPKENAQKEPGQDRGGAVERTGPAERQVRQGSEPLADMENPLYHALSGKGHHRFKVTIVAHLLLVEMPLLLVASCY